MLTKCRYMRRFLPSSASPRPNGEQPLSAIASSFWSGLGQRWSTGIFGPWQPSTFTRRISLTPPSGRVSDSFRSAGSLCHCSFHENTFLLTRRQVQPSWGASQGLTELLETTSCQESRTDCIDRFVASIHLCGFPHFSSVQSRSFACR